MTNYIILQVHKGKCNNTGCSWTAKNHENIIFLCRRLIMVLYNGKLVGIKNENLHMQLWNDLPKYILKWKKACCMFLWVLCGEVYVGVRKGDTDAENFRNIEKNSHLMLLLGKRTRAYGRRKTYFTEFDTHICVQ